MAGRIASLVGILFLSLAGAAAAAAEAPVSSVEFVPFVGGVGSYTTEVLTKGASAGFYLLAGRGDLTGELFFRTTYDKSSDNIDSDRSDFWYELEADGGDSLVELSPPGEWGRSYLGWALNVHGVQNSSYVDKSLNVNVGPAWTLASERSRFSLGAGYAWYDYVVDDEPARDNGFDRSEADFEVDGGYLRLKGERSFESGQRLAGMAQIIVDQHGNLFETRLQALGDQPLTGSGKVVLRTVVEQRFFDLGSRRDILDFDNETLFRGELLFHW